MGTCCKQTRQEHEAIGYGKIKTMNEFLSTYIVAHEQQVGCFDVQAVIACLVLLWSCHFCRIVFIIVDGLVSLMMVEDDGGNRWVSIDYGSRKKSQRVR